MWTSKKKYQLARGYGQVIQMGLGFVISVAGRKFMIPREIGKAIKDMEENKISVGRPSLFSEPASMKGITLPDSIWEKIGEPFSANIALLLDKTLIEGEKENVDRN